MSKVIKFPIPRRHGWEEVLEPLVKRITGAQQADVRGGCNYDCELFFMKPHVLGSCVCSYGKALFQFKKDHPHSVQCFHTFWKEIDDAFKAHPKYHETNILKAARINMVRQLCLKNGIKYNPKTVDELCTCTVQKEWDALGLKHDEDCYKMLPNFWFKKTDLKIWWYKFFFRDAYANQEIEREDFREIVAECMNWVNSNQR